MIGWAQIGYGAALSAAFAVLLLIAARCRNRAALTTAALAAAAGPFAWNAILRAAHGEQFFTDAPVAVFPISWQDTGSAVFTLALASLALALGPLATRPARTGIRYALVAAVAALLTDIYLY
ncbi:MULTISPECIES: hypothetical protein [Streptomyces]|uniref:Uncharacterized protein n=1 Tax=Streptomyces morookaense TaxID=1970 RepID=A0A7Y7B9H5_STRMO|nr:MULTISPECIES: hypothetical protein [Streptomyces]MCC2280415.1 hypothetical protein [Streptomyces sp. ET3-23]NVK81493.1 hypothetical protein [Streptomyces morookaense]GHF24400.1 hypothetical protein GCM10010359_28320 [Streptomyces morookaense]